MTWGCDNVLPFDVPEPCDEGAFWKAAAEALEKVRMPFPGEPDLKLTFSCGAGSCELVAKPRDPHMVGGRRVASAAIFPAAQEDEGGIPGLAPSRYGEMYMTFCSPDSKGGHGSYKFYRLFQNADGTVGAEYGRIGRDSGFGAPRRVRNPYPSWMFHIKAAEKRMKGYRDETAAYVGRKRYGGGSAGGVRPPLPLDPSQRLFGLLARAARGRAARELRFAEGITAEQARAARRELYEAGRRTTVKGFNNRLLALFQVAPRNLARVSDALARDESDFAAILAREETIVAAMEGIVGAKRAEAARGGGLPSFAPLGVDVRLAGEAESQKVESMLSSRLRAKVAEVYAVDNRAQSQRFEERNARRGIARTELFWHGSPAANWASILENSLRLPAAGRAAHGSMFGRGLYFGSIGAGGSSAAEGGGEKSWGYTGARDAYWHRGEGGDVYMAVFEVAYGSPASCADMSWEYGQGKLDALGCDCLHARRGDRGLRNDEVVVYDEAACRIRYLVRFAA
jgi:poly [ADP-ribose] polymerase 2/3/4